MKRLFAVCLVLLLLVPAAGAVGTTYDYQTSNWARQDVEKAIALGLDYSSYGRGDYRSPITRGSFAENAASLVVLESGSDLKSYLRITDYRAQVKGSKLADLALKLANQLGILQGRGYDDWDTGSKITRQEAAVMLARTYRAYHDKVPDSLPSRSFTDQREIADWALADVQLMNQLGIMNGVGENRFDPLGSYTTEQCLVTLLRLHDKAPAEGPKQPNPYALTPREKVIADHWDEGYNHLVFQLETKDYYIFSMYRSCDSLRCPTLSYINIIEPDLSFRQYKVPIIESSNHYQGTSYGVPKNAALSEDGTKLIYTVTVDSDVYYTDVNGTPGPTPVQQAGVYTVTMDLKTGTQTDTRADLPKP